ncbi:MAG: hypothetical protein M3209_09850 [Acidobacteriota bacterium]|nr:hypothetical protein [Acidobacteriota bacterium]
MIDNFKTLQNYVCKFSFNDLAKSFFTLNLWLPNVASPIKTQLLYVVLESVSNRLALQDQIKTYEQFKEFSENVVSLLPSFPVMEDYVPEADWGEIKYFFNEEYYKVFYGGDLSNPYDWYYKFEILHLGFDDFYKKNIGRSPSNELELCLSIQNEIINGISQSPILNENINPGDFFSPSKDFWLNSTSFLNSFDPELIFEEEVVNKYTKTLDGSVSETIPTEQDFINLAHEGKNCFYFFIKKENKIFPVLPRKYFSVLFDTWGSILNENYPLLKEQIKHPELTISFEVSKFIQQRVDEKKIFSLVSIIKPNLHAHETVFASAFISKNKLVLIHVLPPIIRSVNIEERLKNVALEYIELEKILSIKPIKIGLLRDHSIVQFNPSQENTKPLEPLFITCIPFVNTGLGFITPPEDLTGEIIPLDQLLGIFDEVESLDEIAEFYDFREKMRATVGLFSPMTSDLDSFGSFKDSSSVLVRGAIEPNFLMLDPHWGSNFRYRTLSEFWSIFPLSYSFGHPRSWSIIKDSIKEKSFLMMSKMFFGYVHVLKIGQATIFINSPVGSLDYAQGRLTELLMDGLEDALLHYEQLLENLPFAKNEEVIHILFFPDSLLESEEFNHLSHLSPDDSNWKIDIARLPRGKQGIRIVYNEILLRNLLQNAKDRAIQIELLLDVIQKLNAVFGDEGYSEIEIKLEKEKSKKNRYRIFSMEKKISFPELSKYVKPNIKEYKLADKEIANIANNNSITEGKYEGSVAKEKIRQLINGLVTKLDEDVAKFNLKSSIPILISNIDSLTDEYEQEDARVRNSLDQEVNYERDIKSGEGKLEFLHYYQCYKYLIEKFTQLQPQNNDNLTDEKISELLALTDRLIHLYSVSDNLHYGIYPAALIISSDFFVETEYIGVDITEMQKKWQQEQANLKLGQIGNNEDRNILNIDYQHLLDELDQSFKSDLSFSFRNVISVQQILSSWTYFDSSATESTFYKSNEEKILRICEENIDNFEQAEISKVLNFLTLDDKKLLLVEGSSVSSSDLPVWEHRKRTYRYNLRPLIKIEEDFYWGAHSLERSARTWFTTINNYKLPSDLSVPNVISTLDKYHKIFENALQEKIEEIVLRITPFVKTDVFPHKLGIINEDIGDVDVFVLLENKKIILNIESKVIDQVFSNKDLKRLSEKIFGRVKTSDGAFEEGYLQKVEKRADFLKENSEKMVEKVWGKSVSELKVISVFATADSYWWTKYPPIETDVNFIEIRLLEDFINSL